MSRYEDNVDIESILVLEDSADAHETEEDMETLMESVEDILLESDEVDEFDDTIYPSKNEDADVDLSMEMDDEDLLGDDCPPDEVLDKLSEGEEFDGEEELYLEGNDFESDLNVDFFEPIAFSENHVRVFERGDKFLILESDFESVCFHYLGEKDGHQVLETIAESHGIASEDLVIFLAEGETAKPSVSVKKGKSNKGKGAANSIKAKIAALNKQILSLPPNSPSAKAKKDQRKRLRAQLILQGGK
jgi:hypothetical protein